MTIGPESHADGEKVLPEGSRAATVTISSEILKDEHVIFVKLSGRPKPDSIVTMLDELDTLIAQDPSFDVLIDEDGLLPSFIGPGDIGRFVHAWRQASALRSSRIAVFVSNPAMYGLNRMFQSLIGRDGEGRMSVFSDRRGAVAWLRSERSGGR
jgi:hypothetical protein